jgi:hypothetical protein
MFGVAWLCSRAAAGSPGLGILRIGPAVHASADNCMNVHLCVIRIGRQAEQVIRQDFWGVLRKIPTSMT